MVLTFLKTKFILKKIILYFYLICKKIKNIFFKLIIISKYFLLYK